ncbi:hypothetical protein JCM33374_g6532 [Metschnikowia sp. JCM 33374]|nr:hypothetical protein JCM33374_g6532 [Metschnikowia sp. JCM 33374]
MLGHVSVAAMAAEHKINPHYVSSLVEHLKSSGLIRYDELIADATRLIRYSAARLRDSEVGEETNSRVLLSRLANYKAVFVDEFQDVYPSLSSIVQSIVDYPTPGYEGKNKHLTITGDPNQSIYDFLGTNEKDMGLFHTKLPGMEVVDHQLLESFRCTQPILDAANPVVHSSIIAWPMKLSDFFSSGLVHLDDIAILTKTNDTAIAMQSVLKTRYGLPSYKLSSGNQWVASRLHTQNKFSVYAESSSNVSLMAILLTLDSETGGRKRVSKLLKALTKDLSGT